MKSKIESLQIILEEIDPNIIILSEHDMKDEEIERLHINTYNVDSYFSRKATSKGGGVMILSNRKLKTKIVTVPPNLKNKLLEEKLIEFCVMMYELDKFRFIVVSVYRSPSSNVEEFIERLGLLIEFLTRNDVDVIIAGDININVLVDSKEHTLLKNLLKSHNMKYLVKFPTRVCEILKKDSNKYIVTKTAIDNFLVPIIKKQNYDMSVSGIISLLSDHDGQILELYIHEAQPLPNVGVKCESRDFSVQNIQLFKNLLGKELWVDVYFCPPEEKYNVFFESFIYYFNLAFPRKIFKKTNKKLSWFSDELQKEKSELIRCKKEIRCRTSLKLVKGLRERMSKYKNNIYTSKKAFYDKKIAKSNNVQKCVWNIINSEVGNKASRNHENIVLNKGGGECINPKHVCNIFNDYFVNVAKKETNELMSNDRDTDNNNSVQNFDQLLFKPIFNLSEVNAKEIETIFSSFSNKNSSGYDEVPMTVLKTVKKELSQILSHLINSSFVTGKFPDKLKISKVVPIYKKGDKKEVSNYRPISLLPTISKVYERVVYNQLRTFLEDNQLLDEIQHGFRSGRSVISASLSFIESIIESIDAKESCIAIFMDLSKAFDSVNHHVLIEKLKLLGIKSTSLAWFQSYLSNRYQYVQITHLTDKQRVSSFSSQLKPIYCGVPQGSILGPLLFICYLKNMANSLVNVPQSNLCLYADDSNLKISGKSIDQIEVLSHIELENLTEYLKRHYLNLNIDKTNFISFKTIQSNMTEEPNIYVGSDYIGKTNSTKFLGIWVDSKLTWNDHVNKILPKINSGIYALSKMSTLCNEHTLKTIYHSYIHSHIAFGICLYGATKKENLNRILKLQKKAIRIILKLSYGQSVKEYFKTLKILTVYGQYIFDTILVFKNRYIKPDQIIQLHPYNTRHRNNIIPTHHNLEIYKKKPVYAGAKFFKKLPNKLKQESNVNKFKYELKLYLIDKSIYSLEEFMEL